MTERPPQEVRPEALTQHASEDVGTDSQELSDEEGRALMRDALVEVQELADTDDIESTVDLLSWILANEQWLDDHVSYDGLLLMLIRGLLVLNEVDEAVEARSYLDLEVVDASADLRAEHAIQNIFIAHRTGDMETAQRAMRAAVDVVRQSSEEEHHEMLCNALAAIGASGAGPDTAVRERSTRSLGSRPESRANERILSVFTRLQRGEASSAMEDELVALAHELFDGEFVERAGAALLLAGQIAVARNDPHRALSHAHSGRQVLCSRQTTSQLPGRWLTDLLYASMSYALGRPQLASQVMGNLLRNPTPGGSALLSGMAHTVSGHVLIQADPWAALMSGVLAHERLLAFRDSLPTSSEREQFDAQVSGAAEVAFEAADRIGDPALFAEVLEFVRGSGLPTAAGTSPHSLTDGVAPLWALLDVLGIPETRPTWQTAHEKEPLLLAGARPRPRMPWGETAVSASLAAHREGQIVDIQVPR
jgi:hypothetical protein